MIYFVSLLCGSFGALLLSPDSLTVGTSGAVFGLMGAAAGVVARNRGLNLMESGLGIWIRGNLLITFTIPEHLDRWAYRRAGSAERVAIAACWWRCPVGRRVPDIVPSLVCVAIAVGGGCRLDRDLGLELGREKHRCARGRARCLRYRSPARSRERRRRRHELGVEQVAEQLDALDQARPGREK